MTQAEFEALIGKYGPAVDNWPEARREDALDLLYTSAAAQDAYAAAALDDEEDAAATPPATGAAGGLIGRKTAS